MAKTKTRQPKLWAAVFNVNTVDGPETKEYRLLTVAATKKEAITVMTEGVLAFPEVKGAVAPPREIAGRDLKFLPCSKREFFRFLLLVKGYNFIIPYDRMTPDITGNLVMQLME